MYLVIESKSEMPMKQRGLTGGTDGREKACVWDVYWVWWMYSKYSICLHAKDLMEPLYNKMKLKTNSKIVSTDKHYNS